MENLLFICTGNSARSLIAEALFNRSVVGELCAYSAGTRPSGLMNPFALEQARRAGYDVGRLYCKGLDAFRGSTGPDFDYLITVCDLARTELPAEWRGNPCRLHWSMESPFEVAGTVWKRRRVFEGLAALIGDRIDRFMKIRAAIPDPARRALELQSLWP